jgi:hypothetical protein
MDLELSDYALRKMIDKNDENLVNELRKILGKKTDGLKAVVVKHKDDSRMVNFIPP